MSDVTPTPARNVPPINDAGDGQVISETQVKQGARGVKFNAMMVTGTVVALLVMFAIWWALAAHRVAPAGEGGEGRVTTQDARRFDTGPSQPPPQPNNPQGPQRTP